MVKKPDKNTARLKRHARVRKKISGTAARPRLNVFRSAKHIYAQLIDDVAGVTLPAHLRWKKGSKALAETKKRRKRSAWPSHRKHRRKGSPKSSSTEAAILSWARQRAGGGRP